MCYLKWQRLENHWVCLPRQSRAKLFLPCTHSAECTDLKTSPTAGKQRNKEIRTKTKLNRNTFAATLYILVCFVQLFAFFCPLSSCLKEMVPESKNLGKHPPAEQAPELKTLQPLLHSVVPHHPITVPCRQLPLKICLPSPLQALDMLSWHVMGQQCQWGQQDVLRTGTYLSALLSLALVSVTRD